MKISPCRQEKMPGIILDKRKYQRTVDLKRVKGTNRRHNRRFSLERHSICVRLNCLQMTSPDRKSYQIHFFLKIENLHCRWISRQDSYEFQNLFTEWSLIRPGHSNLENEDFPLPYLSLVNNIHESNHCSPSH